MNPIYNFIEFYESDTFYGRLLNSIDDLKTYLEDKLFILVGGGIGSGKTYFIDNILKKIVGNLPVYVDGEYKRELAGNTNSQFKKELSILFTKKKSFIYTGTNANINETIEKLKLAKLNGFTTVLIHIDVPEELAIKQAQQKSETGEINHIEDYKIIKTNKESKEVFEKLKKDRNLVDFYFSFKR